jgi:hypothetical protein
MQIDTKFDLQLFADGTSTDSDFLSNNKLTTTLYRKLLAQAVGTTGTIAKITRMAFGDKGETDDQGNPAPPSAAGDLNNVVATIDIESVDYTADNIVCFTATIEKGTISAAINEVALITEDGQTAAKMRLLTDKGVDAETSLMFKWSIEF